MTLQRRAGYVGLSAGEWLATLVSPLNRDASRRLRMTLLDAASRYAETYSDVAAMDYRDGMRFIVQYEEVASWASVEPGLRAYLARTPDDRRVTGTIFQLQAWVWLYWVNGRFDELQAVLRMQHELVSRAVHACLRKPDLPDSLRSRELTLLKGIFRWARVGDQIVAWCAADGFLRAQAALHEVRVNRHPRAPFALALTAWRCPFDAALAARLDIPPERYAEMEAVAAREYDEMVSGGSEASRCQEA